MEYLAPGKPMAAARVGRVPNLIEPGEEGLLALLYESPFMPVDTLVLCYHAVSETWPAALSTTPARFEEHVARLAAHGYRGVTFHEAITSPASGRRVAITFDDAYLSVLELARPILDRFGVPATVFAPTAFAGRDEPMAWPGIDHWLGTDHAAELLPMSWVQLGELADHGWEIGSHTRTHPRLTTCDENSLTAELAVSRAECEHALGRPCRTLAYPYGDHDDRVVEAARSAGYEAAGTLAVALPLRLDAHSYPRIGIYNGDDDRRFGLKISPTVRRLRASAWTGMDALRRVGR